MASAGAIAIEVLRAASEPLPTEQIMSGIAARQEAGARLPSEESSSDEEANQEEIDRRTT